MATMKSTATAAALRTALTRNPVLSLYCVHANIPMHGILNLLKSLYEANARLVNEEQSTLQ